MANFDGTVLVLGASGPTGQHVVHSLRAKGIAVRALLRSAEHMDALKLTGDEGLIGQTTDVSDLRAALQGVSAVIDVLGTKPQDTPDQRESIESGVITNLLRFAPEVGLKQIVLCSSIGTETPDMMPFLETVLRAKRQGEVALESGGVPYTIVRPGGLVNEPGGNDVVVARSLKTSGRIARADVAEVLVQALLQPAARNQIVEIINQPGAGKANRDDLFSGA